MKKVILFSVAFFALSSHSAFFDVDEEGHSPDVIFEISDEDGAIFFNSLNGNAPFSEVLSYDTILQGFIEFYKELYEVDELDEETTEEVREEAKQTYETDVARFDETNSVAVKGKKFVLYCLLFDDEYECNGSVEKREGAFTKSVDGDKETYIATLDVQDSATLYKALAVTTNEIEGDLVRTLATGSEDGEQITLSCTRRELKSQDEGTLSHSCQVTFVRL